MWKWLVGTFVVLAVLCGGGGYFIAATEKGRSVLAMVRPRPNYPEVRLDPVARGDLVRTVNAPGTIEPKTKVAISAQVSARITALPFREGESVRAGEVIVRLDSRDSAAALESAQARLKGEQAQLEGARAARVQAEAEARRARELFASKDLSQADLDRAEAEYLRAEAAVRAAEQAIEAARANIVRAERDLDNCTITSPIDGTITKLNNEVGELVLGTFNNQGPVIIEIADLSVMLMKARVDETNIAPVAIGQRAKIYINAHPGQVFEGRVERVGLKRLIDRDQTGYFEVEVLVDKPQGLTLRQGLNANTDIEVETLRDVIRIPTQAVVDRRVDELPTEVADANAALGQRKAFARVVYRVVDDAAPGDGRDPGGDAPRRYRTIATPVVIGSSDLTHTVVLQGLAEGSTIVTGPYKALVALKHDETVVDQSTVKKKEDRGKGESQRTARAGGGGPP